MRDLLSTILRFAAVLLGCISVHGIHSADAQTVPTPSMADQLIKGIFHPSPTTAAFMRYGEYPVDHSTGVPKIEIPLYTLDTGDYQLPVSISYHASGIKVNDVSSPVGLGWVLNAGGLVSRTACAVPDHLDSQYRLYFKDKGDVRSCVDSGWNFLFWNRLFSGASEFDSETDRYFYSFAGKSGIFRYDVYTMDIFPVPHDAIIIEEYGTPGSGYVITDSDGSRYFFTQKETCGGYYGAAVSGWYLTKIITGGKHNEINISYSNCNAYTVRYRAEYYDSGDVVTWDGTHEEVHPGTNNEFKLINYVHTVPLVKTISWKDVTVEFNYENDRLDAQRERLVSMTVTDSGGEIRHVSFDNDQYFGSHDQNYRMKLDGISVKGNSDEDGPEEKWSFSYDSQTPPNHYNWRSQSDPPYDLRCYEDWWGYYNGRTSVHAIPDGIVPGMDGADKTSVESFMKMCSLKSITYPTGGSTEFGFEANRSGNTLIGGLCVASIVNKDCDGTVLERKTYEYPDANMEMGITSDLFSYYDNVWYFYQDFAARWFSSEKEHFFAVSQPILPLTGWSGAPVFYPSVTEYLGTPDDNLGKTVYSYLRDTESSYPGSDEDLYAAPLHMRFYSNLYNNDEGIVKALPTKTEYYRTEDDGSYTKIRTESISYTEHVPLRDTISTGVRIGRMGIGVFYGNSPTPAYAPYGSADEYLGNIVYTSSKGYRKLRLPSSFTTTDHLTGVSTVTQYSYDSGKLRTLRPLSIGTVNSDSKVRTVSYTYPFGLDTAPYTEMTAAGYADIPVAEALSYGGELQKSVVTEYSRLISSGDTLFVPSSVSQTADGVTSKLADFVNYDAFGNLRHFTVTADDSRNIVLWGYGGRYPVVLVQGLSWSQLISAVPAHIVNSITSCDASNAASLIGAFRDALENAAALASTPFLVTSYTYLPGIGVESMETPAGNLLSYEYDELGRLTGEEDSIGEIARYSYAYASFDSSGALVSPNRITTNILQEDTSLAPGRPTKPSYISTSKIFDGLGRLSQTIEHDASTEGRSLVSMLEYDLAGRQIREWLPTPFTGTSPVEAEAFKDTATIARNDSRPFMETVLEPSALARPTAEYGPGEDWYPAHPVSYSRLGNCSPTENLLLACKYYHIGTTGGLISSGYHAAGRLEILLTSDEDGNRSYRFTDKLGRTVLTRQVDSTENGFVHHDTYYVYDGRDRLRYILQPQYQADPDLDEFAFQYNYDSRDNLIRSKIPGVSHVETIFDSHDRPIFIQDGPRRGRNRWSFTEYDGLSRVVRQGECTAKDTSSFPQTLTVNHYDDYSFAGSGGFADSVYPEDGEFARGRLTGQEMLVLSPGPGMAYADRIYTSFVYDERGRLTETVRNHPADSTYGHEKVTTIYSPTDKVLGKITYRYTGFAEVPQSTDIRYTYDSRDRLGRIETVRLAWQEGLIRKTHAAYNHDEFGRTASKVFAGNSLSNIQVCSYDIRDRLTQSSHRVFSENISYVDGTTGKGYNGNASSVSSTLRTYHPSGTSLVRQQGWQFRYDGLGRMKSALPMRMLSAERSSETIGEYDLNGNILSLVRQGRTARGTYGVIDSLSLSYSGNRLVAVSDSKGEAAQDGFEFAADSAAFSYDSAGRLTADSSRGIQSVSYYPTGDPEKVVFSDGSSTIYLYAADGTKLRSQHNSASGSRTLDFCGSLIYGNLSPKWLLYDEGYRDFGTVSGGMRFFIKDRLGSIRSVVDSTGAVMGQYIYFPFGGPADAVSADDGIQPFRFSGKEWDPALSSLDFGRRTYLPAIARWSSPDPLADKYPGISPYAYCAGNPVNIVDPDGRYLETAFDVTSLVLGINSLRQNIRDGKVWASILDGAGVLADAVAVALPIIPGGASAAIAGVRAADDIIDAARTADNITDAAGAAADAVKAADDIHDASITYRSFTRSNFRENLIRKTGKSGIGMEAHHTLPVKFESRFNEIGINIHDPKYGVWVETSEHKRKAYEYNKKWETFWGKYEKAGIQPSNKDVLDFRETAMSATN